MNTKSFWFFLNVRPGQNILIELSALFSVEACVRTVIYSVTKPQFVDSQGLSRKKLVPGSRRLDRTQSSLEAFDTIVQSYATIFGVPLLATLR